MSLDLQDTGEDGPLAGEFNGEFIGGESSQTNGFEHIIKFSFLTDMIFRMWAVLLSTEGFLTKFADFNLCTSFNSI
jgi:hypothetical protein